MQADSEIQQNANVSSIITLLDQHGSSVLLGNNLMVPLDQTRPLHPSALRDEHVEPAAAAALRHRGLQPGRGHRADARRGACRAFSAPTSRSGGTTPPPSGGSDRRHDTATYYLDQAAADYTAAQQALKSGNLGNYQSDVDAMNKDLKDAQTALKAG